uniref:NADH-ubiquinone oxidoreductase chain 4L n=1 Tax=Agrilinae sp. 1 ACP-2013 TaxID=1434404 RepID=A0A3G4RYD6_9COLE|nr:NADH dehydrogenase subunit 4L [Agrilinae sp. 1 ACP-2013]
MLILYYTIFTSFVGLLVFCSKRKHLLLTLLSLEFVVLSLYFMASYSLSLYGYEYFFLMVFLTFSVCEGALGLSILVSLIRSHGNDYFQSFNVLW